MITVDCPEFDDFQAALRGVNVRYVLRARQQRDWRLTRTDLNGVGLMQGREGAAIVCSGAALADYFNVIVSLGGRGSFAVDGHSLDGGKIGWMVPDRLFHRETSQPAGWLRVTMTIEAVKSWFSSRMDEANPELLTRNLVRTAARPVAELIRLAHRVFEVDAQTEEGLRGPEKERAIGLEVLDAALRAVVPLADEAYPRRAVAHGAQALNRALAFIASRTDRQVHAEDLCRVTGVSERTLRNVFYRHLGMAPHQYLMIARLHDVRAAIREAGPGINVSRICADLGIWDFGRFAAQYRRLFGVLPSQELSARRTNASHGRFPREATCRSSVARGYSPNSA